MKRFLVLDFARLAAPVCVVSSLGLGAIANDSSAASTRSAQATDAFERVLDQTRSRIAALPADDEFWQQVAPTVDALMARSEAALRNGRRELAQLTFAYAVENVAAQRFLLAHAAERAEFERFEALWHERDRAFDAAALAKVRARAEALQSACVRALGEAAFAKLRVNLDASLDYGRATDAATGVFYLGLAEAQAEFVEQLGALASPTDAAAPPVRALAAELDALERELVALYRPPLSIDRHAEFIAASGTLKEARVLDQAGLRFGALLRHGQAVQRCAALRATPGTDAPERNALEQRIATLASELTKLPFDASIGRIFAQRADELVEHGDLAAAATFADALAAHLATFRAPAAPVTRPTPELDVTLVRWPFT
ncbi:MAG: hypothetical protein L6Q99_02010 [Planctomycetes bacterium]|nr:hypothetical protein [Planctomycetota bacterium]